MSKEKSQALVAELQAKKKPLADQRSELQNQLKEMRAEAQAREKVIRDQILALHQQMAPIDHLLSSADGLKNLKGETADMVEAHIQSKIEEL